MNYTLVIHFNAFTGKLMDGYLMLPATKQVVERMTRDRLLAYLEANPDVRCDPLEV